MRERRAEEPNVRSNIDATIPGRQPVTSRLNLEQLLVALHMQTQGCRVRHNAGERGPHHRSITEAAQPTRPRDGEIPFNRRSQTPRRSQMHDQ